jgi:hypothetical protein
MIFAAATMTYIFLASDENVFLDLSLFRISNFRYAMTFFDMRRILVLVSIHASRPTTTYFGHAADIEH